MEILLDARVMQQPLTGIAKVTLGLYRSCLNVVPSMQVFAIHQDPISCELPYRIHDVQKGCLVSGKFWQNFVLPALVLFLRPEVIHFPWNGNIPRMVSDAIVVTTLHDVLPLNIPGYFSSVLSEWAYRRRKQRDINRSHLLITDSEYSKQQILRNFSVKTEPVVVYPGQTLMANSSRSPSAPPTPRDYFLYVGGYDPRKGLLPLVKTFIGLHRRKKISGKLILTGERHYYCQELKETITEGLDSNRIEEMGYVSDELLADLYRNAKALVYPSRYEGFGLPPLEAMSLGCPVITTRHTSIPEVCGDAALYMEPDDEQDVSQALIALDRDPALRSHLREKGLRRAAGFTWESAAKNFLSALQSVMKKKGAGRQGAGFAGSPSL